MRKYSKIMLLSAALILMIAALLTSCNNTSNNEVQQSPTPDTAAAAIPDLGKFISVVVKSDNADYSAGNEATKQKIIEAIANERGVMINFEVIELSEENFATELNQLLSSGVAIDSITADYDLLATYVSIPGLLKPIDSLLDTSGANLYNAIDSTYWDVVTVNSEIYGVPGMPYPEKSIMMTRGDISYMFTTEPVDAYSKLISLCQFYKMAGYEYPLALTWEQIIDIMAYSWGIPVESYTINKKNEFVMREQLPKYTTAFLPEIKLLYETGLLHPDLFSASSEQMKAEFMAGRSAVYVAEMDDLFADRAMLKSVFPDAELQIVSPLSTRTGKNNNVLSGETTTDTVLMFMSNGQNSEALMTYLDWAYTSQLNHTMTELGAYGQLIMYNPAMGEYEYLGGYSIDNKPYDGLYTLGLSTDMLYTPPIYKQDDSNDTLSRNALLLKAHSYLTENTIQSPVAISLNDTTKSALQQYDQLMRTAAEQYVKGEIGLDELLQYERSCKSSGLLDTLLQEIGVPYLIELGLLD